MGAPVYLTRGQIRQRCLNRLGFGGLGAAAGKFVPYLDDLLDEAQEQIYEFLPDEKRKTKFEFNTVIVPNPETWYDIPANLNPEHIDEVNVKVNDYWIPVHQGITQYHDSLTELQTYPRRYELKYNSDTGKAQIEIWPQPDAVYPISIEGQLQLEAFVADGDKCSMDYRLIVMYCVAYGKAHLNRPDKTDAMNALNLRLKALRGNQHGNERYIRGQRVREPDPKPRVV